MRQVLPDDAGLNAIVDDWIDREGVDIIFIIDETVGPASVGTDRSALTWLMPRGCASSAVAMVPALGFIGVVDVRAHRPKTCS